MQHIPWKIQYDFTDKDIVTSSHVQGSGVMFHLGTVYHLLIRDQVVIKEADGFSL